jgi:hypothetical protein
MMALLTACGTKQTNSTAPSTVRSDTTVAGPYTARILTPSSTAYHLASRANGVTVRASATGAGNNLREAFWPMGQVPARNVETCATWPTQNGGTDPGRGTAQQGLALRITTTDGITRAVTLTKNVYAGSVWVFNVHVWNTSTNPPFHEIGNKRLGHVLDPRKGSGLVPLPWHACARVVGSRFEFVVWPREGPQPSYNDRTHGMSLTLPPGYGSAGNYGWYIGHLQPGSTAAFTNLHTATQ